MTQILSERSLWQDNTTLSHMTLPYSEPKLNARTVWQLAKISQMRKALSKNRGAGIERTCSSHQPEISSGDQTLACNITGHKSKKSTGLIRSMHANQKTFYHVLPLVRVRRFARKARD